MLDLPVRFYATSAHVLTRVSRKNPLGDPTDKRGRSCHGWTGRAVPLYPRRDFSILFAVNIPRAHSRATIFRASGFQ